jgi:tRNA threonylcarbamoyladenosine biosynthesis protein TsaE
VIDCRTKSAEDTRELAGTMAPFVRPGDVILLAGELGVGKTVFAQGLGRAIGVDQPITSPTFTLIHEYDAPACRVMHADLYRLDRLQEVIDLGLTELVDDDAIAMIEWGDLAEAAFATDFLEARIAYVDGEEDARTISLRTVGPAWGARLPGLQRALERWSTGPNASGGAS